MATVEDWENAWATTSSRLFAQYSDLLKGDSKFLPTTEAVEFYLLTLSSFVNTKISDSEKLNTFNKYSQSVFEILRDYLCDEEFLEDRKYVFHKPGEDMIIDMIEQLTKFITKSEKIGRTPQLEATRNLLGHLLRFQKDTPSSASHICAKCGKLQKS